MGQGSGGNVIAAVASFFFPGLGQLLQGRVGSAAWHCFLFWLLIWVGIGIFVLIYSVYDAAVWESNR